MLTLSMLRPAAAARGMVIANRHGQLIETQIGPMAFDSEDMCDAWLRAAAAGLNIERVCIDRRDAGVTTTLLL